MKIYAFYTKSDNMLYAFTDKKDMKNIFKTQRNLKKFIYKKFSADEEFINKYIEFYLVMTPLSNIDMACTITEDNAIHSKADEYDMLMDEAYRQISNKIVLPKKYVKSIKYLLENYYYTNNEDGTKDCHSTADMFRIFVSMFGYTLKKGSI